MSNFVVYPLVFLRIFPFYLMFSLILMYIKIDSWHIYPLNERAMSQHQFGNKFCTVLQLPVDIYM